MYAGGGPEASIHSPRQIKEGSTELIDWMVTRKNGTDYWGGVFAFLL